MRFRHILSALAALCLFSGGAWAQSCGPYPYTFANGTVADATQVNADFATVQTCSISINGHVVVLGNSVTLTGADLAVSQTSASANYAASSSDCSTVLGLGGNAQYTLTVGVATGFTANCSIRVVNTDVAPPTGRGKKISINGLTFPQQVLYPGQSFTLDRVGNVWVVSGLSRYRTAGTTVNLYTNFSNGNDANDGFAGGAGNAKKTLQACLDTVDNDFDLSAWSGALGEPTGQTQVVCNVNTGATDTTGVHFAPHSLLGAQGGAALKIQGDGGVATVSTNGVDAMGFFLGTQVQLRNLQLKTTGANTNCLTAGYSSDIRILDGVTFGPCVTGDISVQDKAGVTFSNDYGIGDAGGLGSLYHYTVSDRGYIYANAALTVSGNKAAANTFALVAQDGLADLRNITFSGAAAGAVHANVADRGLVLTATGVCDTDLPGTVASTLSTWGQCGKKTDVAHELITNNCPNPAVLCQAACTAGKKIVGGGCVSNGSAAALSSAYPNSATQWTCNYAAAPVTSIDAKALCTYGQ